MKLFVVDIETTGLDPEKDAVVEIATVELVKRGSEWWTGPIRTTLVNPQRPIPPETSAVHGIIDADIEAITPSLDLAIDYVLPVGERANGVVLAGHNAIAFDSKFLPPGLTKHRWIDTCRCAMHLFPEAPRFSNGALRYWLKLEIARRRDHRIAHTAAADATTTALILSHMLNGEHGRSAKDLLVLSHRPALLRKVGFGKHFGMLWTDVPFDYLQWAKKQDFDEDVMHTVNTEFERRVAK